MENKNKISIIEEALADYNAIMEAAESSVKNKIENEIPKKLNDIINENINNYINKNEKNMKNFDKNDENEFELSDIDYDKLQELFDISDDENIDNEFNDEDDEYINKKKYNEKINKYRDYNNQYNNIDKNKKKFNKNDDLEDFDLEDFDDSIYEELQALENIEELQDDEVNNLQNEGGELLPDEMSPEEFNRINNINNNNSFNKNKVSNDEIEEDENLEDEISDDEIEKNEDLDDEKLEKEGYGVSHAANKITTANNPRPEYASSPGAVSRRRPEFANENINRIKNLLDENKKLSLKINELRNNKKTLIALLENYKKALEKYRIHLKEMAIFNTNIAHVNNLLVNENLALTQNDKINIINEFKNIKDINESQNKYLSLLKEYSNKAKINEDIENKISFSIQSSSNSKEIMNEIVEKTAYSNNNDIQKIKKLINYIENKK